PVCVREYELPINSSNVFESCTAWTLSHIHRARRFQRHEFSQINRTSTIRHTKRPRRNLHILIRRTNQNLIELGTPRPHLRCFITNRVHERQGLKNRLNIIPSALIDLNPHETINDLRLDRARVSELRRNQFRERNHTTREHGGERDSPIHWCAVRNKVRVDAGGKVADE